MQNTLIIARRKAGKVRMLDNTTAKMGKWVPDPTARRNPYSEDMRAAYVTGYSSDAMLRTVAQLRRRAEMLNVPVNSRMRKAEISDALANASFDAWLGR